MNIGSFLLVNLLNGVMAAVLLGISFWIFKVLVFGHEFSDVLREKGVSGGAIILAAFIIGMGFAIGFASF